jgi:HD-GYP domain-containing protein (c-di-GMP phosphodiesterase class II)
MSSNLVTVSFDAIQIGQPLPFAIKGPDGQLLAKKGFVIQTRAELEEMAGRGFSFYIDVVDSEAHQRAYISKLHKLVRNDKTLGQIAGVQIMTTDLPADSVEIDQGPPDWLDLQIQANTILRDCHSPNFLKRLDWLHRQLDQYTLHNPDGALFALFHLSASRPQLYSATHAMLVSVMCGLATRDVLNWPPEQVRILSLAALTMNLSMVELQDRLAMQMEPPSPVQRRQIDSHALRCVELLEQLGVTDLDWLEAVADHHIAPGGGMAKKSVGQRMARLIQRADTFAARLAPRASRDAASQASAMQASYFDENKAVDEAGAALIKAVGIYSPGSYVRLSTNEVAVVIRRGSNTTTPRVAVVLNREGLATVEPTIRDTSQREYRIFSGVAHKEVRVQLNLQRMLALTASPASDRVW